MSDDKKSYTLGGSFFSILLFLLFCNLFQPNTMLGELLITTIFWAMLWSVLLVLIIGGLFLLIGIVIIALKD